MNIKIDIDDTKMSELISRGIDEIDKETFGEIVRKSLTCVFSNAEVAKELVLKKDNMSYYSSELTLRPWVVEMIKSSITKEDIEKYRKMIFDIIDEHGREIVLEAIVKAFTSNMFNSANQMDFCNRLTNEILGRIEAKHHQ